MVLVPFSNASHILLHGHRLDSKHLRACTHKDVLFWLSKFFLINVFMSKKFNDTRICFKISVLLPPSVPFLLSIFAGGFLCCRNGHPPCHDKGEDVSGADASCELWQPLSGVCFSLIFLCRTQLQGSASS